MRSVMQHNFAKTPQVRPPRSVFNRSFCHKTTFDASYLVPVYCEEVYPGDTIKMKPTLFARLQTLKFPIMDNIHLDSFYFFVPFRLLWDHWEQFNGARDTLAEIMNPTEYLTPVLGTEQEGADWPATQVLTGSLSDYMGLPLTNQEGVTTNRNDYLINVSAMWHRAYYFIWNEFFRDQNLQEKVTEDRGDGPDITGYTLLKRCKKRDYVTQCLPFAQKGPSIELPLGSEAPVRGLATSSSYGTIGITDGTNFGGVYVDSGHLMANVGLQHTDVGTTPSGTIMAASKTVGLYPSGDKEYTGMYADLTSATAATINSIREAFQLQRLLERDARGGTRYIEMVYSQFGVTNPDFRLQRPELLSTGSFRINIHQVAKTSENAEESPLAKLAAYALGVGQNGGFFKSFTEHGCILGLVNVRADLTYQQGVPRMFSRRTRYDYYLPVLANLGEQAVLKQEVYASGSANGTENATDLEAFGFVPPWDDLRHKQSIVSGLFRSELDTSLDAWHLSYEFASLPSLNGSFIADTANQVIDRVIAVTDENQIIFDSYFDITHSRVMPAFGVPGLIDHF